MSLTAATYAEACEIAADLRALFAAADWVVSIVAPLFDGDLYRINVGA